MICLFNALSISPAYLSTRSITRWKLSQSAWLLGTEKKSKAVGTDLFVDVGGHYRVRQRDSEGMLGWDGEEKGGHIRIACLHSPYCVLPSYRASHRVARALDNISGSIRDYRVCDVDSVRVGCLSWPEPAAIHLSGSLPRKRYTSMWRRLLRRILPASSSCGP